MAVTVMNTRCPHCGKVNELASGLNGATSPDEGSITMCMTCGKWSIFELDFIGLRLRPPTDAEWALMEQDETVQSVSEAWDAGFRGKKLR